MSGITAPHACMHCTGTPLHLPFFFLYSVNFENRIFKNLTSFALYVFSAVFMMYHVVYGRHYTQCSVPRLKARIITGRANRVSHYTAQTEQLSDV